MAQRVNIELVDDIDGSSAVETVLFGLDGTTYEIDLNKKNAAALRKAIAPYVDAGRKVTNRGSKGGRTKPAGTSDSKKIREWAAQNSIEVPARGRIPQDVRDKYDAAN